MRVRPCFKSNKSRPAVCRTCRYSAVQAPGLPLTVLTFAPIARAPRSKAMSRAASSPQSRQRSSASVRADLTQLPLKRNLLPTRWSSVSF